MALPVTSRLRQVSLILTSPETLRGSVDRHQLAFRIGSAVVGIPVVAGAIWLGPIWLTALVGLAAALGSWELCAMAKAAGRRPAPVVAVGWSLALVALAHFATASYTGDVGAWPLVSIGVLAFLTWQVRQVRARGPASDWAITAGAAIYTGGLLGHALLLRNLDDGRWWVVLVVLVTFTADTMAYVTGRLVGKTPLAPSISPRKTWEGAVGGVAAAVAAAPVVASVMGVGVSVAAMAFLGAVLGIVGQLGDLVESYIKRAAGVKDSGWVVPGHGGIMDRLDSIVLNVAVMYYFVIWVVQ